MPDIDNNGSLNDTQTTPEAKPTEGQAVVTPDNAQAAPAPIEPQKAADTAGWDYKTDPRWGKMWKTEADIIKSYHEADTVLEKKYKPAYKQYEAMNKLFTDNGIEADKISDYINEYKSLKDPQYPANALWSMLSPYLQNPEYVAQIDSVMENIRRSEMQRMYPGMTEEQISRQKALEEKVSRFEEMTRKQEEQAQYQTSMSTLQKEFKGIEDYAASIGFQLSDDIKHQLLEHCMKENVPIKYMAHEFRQLFNDQIKTYEQQKLKAQILAEQEKQNKTHIKVAPSAPVNNPIVGQKKDTITEGLRKAFGMST